MCQSPVSDWPGLVTVNLRREGLLLKEGSIVDATSISAPTLTKNKDAKLDPEMRQAKKDNGWHFRMKMHIGVDETLAA